MFDLLVLSGPVCPASLLFPCLRAYTCSKSGKVSFKSYTRAFHLSCLVALACVLRAGLGDSYWLLVAWVLGAGCLVHVCVCVCGVSRVRLRYVDFRVVLCCVVLCYVVVWCG